MTFRNVVKMLALVVVCCAVLTSCTKKPKIDLSGIRTNPAGGPGINGDDTFITGDPDDGGEGGLNIDGDGKNDWGGMNNAVPGGFASDFISNAQKWSDIVYFAYDRAELPVSERSKVENLANYLQDNPTLGVVIEGHCDERGSDEYNRALSERRAMSVRAYLSSLGISDNRMQTVSFGEDRPAVANAQSEAEHSLNRRAEFQYGTLK